LFSWDSMFSHAPEASYHFNIRLFLYAVAHLCQPCSPPSFVFYMAICYSKKAHLVVFLFISLLQRVVFHLISFFLFISTSSSLFLQTLTQHVFVNPAHPLLLFFTWPAVTYKSTSCRLPPYFSFSTSRLLPYFLISLRQHIIFLIFSNP
jgi:hypothetical protein